MLFFIFVILKVLILYLTLVSFLCLALFHVTYFFYRYFNNAKKNINHAKERDIDIFPYCGHHILPNTHSEKKRYIDNRTDRTEYYFWGISSL